MFHFDINPSKQHRRTHDDNDEDDDDIGYRAFSDDGQNSEAAQENGEPDQEGEEEVQYSSVFADMNDNLDELGEDGEEVEREPVQRKKQKTAPASVSAKPKSTNPKKRKRPEQHESQDEEENSSSSGKAAASKKGRPKKAKTSESAPAVKPKKTATQSKQVRKESDEEDEEEEEEHVGSLDALLQNKKLALMQEEKADPEAEKSAKRAKIAETKDLLKRETEKIANNPRAGPDWVLTEYTMLRGPNEPFKVAYIVPAPVLKLELIANGKLKEAGSRLNGQVEAFKSASKAREEQSDEDKIRLANLYRAGQELVREGMSKMAKASGTSQMYIGTSPFAQWDPKKKVATEGITLLSTKQMDEYAKTVDNARVVELLYRATKAADQDVTNHPFGKQLLELVPRNDDDVFDPTRLGWFNFSMLALKSLDGLAARQKKKAAVSQQKKKIANEDDAEDENEN